MPDDKIEITRRQSGKVQNLRSSESHQIQVKTKFYGHVLEMQDVHFHHNSAVMMPYFDDDAGTPEPNRITGLMVLAVCYCHVSQHPLQQILIAGHTDTSGAEAYNIELSQLRADNVLSALTGDRVGWVQTAQQKHKVEDYQQILKCVAQLWRWGCDPETVDGIHGSKTQAALEQFQIRYNQAFEASIAEDGILGPQTWGAFFDVYMRMLAEILETDDTGLATLRRQLNYLDAERRGVGCGEHFPIEAARQNNYRSSTNRRVEILFFDPGEEPRLECHSRRGRCTPGQCEVYNPRMYQYKHIPCEILPIEERDTFLFIIDELGEPMKNTSVKLTFDDGRELTMITDDEGKIYPYLREGEPFNIELHDIHEFAPNDNAQTPSGQHFPALQGGTTA